MRTKVRTWSLHVLRIVFGRIVFGLILATNELPLSQSAEVPVSPPAPHETPHVPETQGITHVLPNSGRFVQVDQSTWMVPYREVLIPGKIELEMVPIPGGLALIGSTNDDVLANADEKPQFQVQVGPFWMASTETTWAMYQEFQKSYSTFRQQMLERAANELRIEDLDAVTAPTPLYESSFAHEFGDTDHPAITMTQFAARQFSKWLSLQTDRQYRLPTEIEWEYACRAGSATHYSFGNDPALLGIHAVFGRSADNAVVGTDRVAMRRPNPWGLYDMHGNVAEWVVDHYATDGYLLMSQRLLRQPDSRGLTAHHLDQLWGHGLRGGSWADPAVRLRSSARHSSSVELQEYDPALPASPYWLASEDARTIGFRLVRSYATHSPEVISRFWNPDSQELDAALRDYLQMRRGVVGVMKTGGG